MKRELFLSILLVIFLSTRINNIDVDLDSSNVFSVDMTELEKEIIPNDKSEEANIKHNSKINMVLVDFKYEHLSMQTSMKYSGKTDIITPCWFTLSKDRSKKDELNIKIEGHDRFKVDFVNNLRYDNKSILIIPRISCENNFKYLSDQTAFFNEKSIKKLASDIEKRSKYYKIDGFYLDCTELQIHSDFEDTYKTLIENIGVALKKANKKFIIAIHPTSEKINHFITSDSLVFYSEFIDYFVVLVGEYNKYAKKPVNYYNAPFFWIIHNIETYSSIKQKFILSLPFHGISYKIKENERADINIIDSSSFFSMVLNGKSKNILSHKWDNYGKEHLIHIMDIDKDLYLSYPTRKFISERIDLVKDFDIAGLAINDLMQGFEDFMDFL